MITLYIYILFSFGISALLIPIVIKFCKTHGLYDSTGGRKIHSGNIPRLGSIGFVTAFVIVSTIYVCQFDSANINRLLPLIIAGLVIFIFGILDDFIEMKALVKLFIQIAAALIVVLNNFTFTRFGPIELGIFGPFITFCWIIGMINSLNLIDGVDGLCGGLSTIIITTIGIIYFRESPTISAVCFIQAAAIVGFLLYNKPKAKIFMGDGGSQFLGFMIAVLPLYSTATHFEYNKMPIAFLLASIPIFDTIAAVIRRVREKRSILSSDKAHLHHKLMDMGYTSKGILGILYSMEIFICTICIISVKLNTFQKYRSIILFGGLFAMVVFFTIIHFTYHNVKKLEQSDFVRRP